MVSTTNLLDLHMKKLCDIIGPRPTGSEGNKAAVQYAAETFKNLGYEVTLQEFSCIDWKNQGTKLIIDNTEIEITSAEYSLPCDVSGELVCVKDIKELKSANLNKKICVMYGDLCKEVLMPKSMKFYNPDEHKEIIQELESKKPLAVITISFLSDVPVSIIQDGDFNIPCATVKGTLLNTLLNCNETVTLQIKTKRQPSKAANVIATYGNNTSKMSFSAHIDTKPTTPGALDNGSGVAVLLALANKISKTKYPYKVEFTLFNGEDYYSTPGEIMFMNTYLQNPDSYVCSFNIDGVGMKNSNTSYSFYECPDSLQNHIDNFASNNELLEKINPWPMGDHMLFAMSGIPSIAVTASQIFSLSETVMHTPKDDLTMIDLNHLNTTVDFLFNCTSNLKLP